MTTVHQNTDWSNRRIALYRVAIFCAGVIVYCLLFGESTELYTTAMTMSFGLLATITSSYLIGQSYENGKIHKK